MNAEKPIEFFNNLTKNIELVCSAQNDTVIKELEEILAYNEVLAK